MSSLNREIDYSNMSETLRFVFEQLMKGVYTSMPAIIDSYDPATRRARVIPASRLVQNNGEAIDRPAIPNVPVMQTGVGSFFVNFEVPRGTAVMLVFSQRSMAEFKQGYQVTTPGTGILDIKDAVAFLSFGDLNINPVQTTGISIQNRAGNSYITLDNQNINVNTVQQVNVTAPNVNITGNVTINGSLAVSGAATGVNNQPINLGTDATINGVNYTAHTHSGVTTGTSNTGVPNSG